jgi:hypothetical protein
LDFLWIFFEKLFLSSLPGPCELVSVEALIVQQEAVLDIAENLVFAFHP